MTALQSYALVSAVGPNLPGHPRPATNADAGHILAAADNLPTVFGRGEAGVHAGACVCVRVCVCVCLCACVCACTCACVSEWVDA